MADDSADIKQSLEKNAGEFIQSGDEDLEKERFNSAVSSYFKATVVLCDLKIYEERRLLPKNHSERFLFLKIHFKEAYEIVNLLFNKYTDSYNLRLSKKDALFLKENVEKIKKIFGFS